MRVDSRNPFEVAVYDKDGGYYNTLHRTPSESMAMRIAQAIAKLIKKDAYRNPENNEPYDWVTVFHKNEAVTITA